MRADNEYSEPAGGFKELVDRMKILIIITPPDYHFGTQKIMFLKKKAVVDHTCAKEAVKNINPLNYNFKDLVTSLHN